MRKGAGVALAFTVCLTGCGGPVPSTARSGTTTTEAAPTAPAQTPSAPPTGQLSGPARLPDRMRALGTEPFWGVEIDGARLVYTTPEDQQGRTVDAVREDSAIASTWTAQLDGKRFELTIVPEKCSDGMSDTEYAFSARLRLAGGMHRGCARIGS